MTPYRRTPPWINQAPGAGLETIGGVTSPRPRILVVDDQEVFRRLVGDLLDRHGYTALPAASGEEAIALAQQGLAIALALLDVMMPEAQIQGVQAARVLAHTYGIRCLMLTSIVEAGTRAAATLAGALGYLVKDVVDDAAILAGVRAALEGEPVPDPLDGLAIPVADAFAIHQRQQRLADAYAQLTPAQRRVAELAAENKTNEEIATILGVAPTTVSTHISDILGKLGLESRRSLHPSNLVTAVLPPRD